MQLKFDFQLAGQLTNEGHRMIDRTYLSIEKMSQKYPWMNKNISFLFQYLMCLLNKALYNKGVSEVLNLVGKKELEE